MAIGATAFAIFTRSQRKWDSPPYTPEVVAKFKETLAAGDFQPSHVVPHGSYLINLGSPNEETRTKSRVAFLDEMRRCQQLGLTMYNFHPGSSCGLIPREQCIRLIAEGINGALAQTQGVSAVVENMAGQARAVAARAPAPPPALSTRHAGAGQCGWRQVPRLGGHY